MPVCTSCWGMGCNLRYLMLPPAVHCYVLHITNCIFFICLQARASMQAEMVLKEAEAERQRKRIKELEEMQQRLQDALQQEIKARHDEEAVRYEQARYGWWMPSFLLIQKQCFTTTSAPEKKLDWDNCQFPLYILGFPASTLLKELWSIHIQSSLKYFCID